MQETKLDSVDRSVTQNLWGGNNFEFRCSNLVGASGGILTLWKNDFFRATNIIIHRSFILLQGVLFNNFPCVLVTIYAPNEVVGHRELWEDLMRIKANIHEPWCIGGF
ncbi:hypothetical protein RHMOL_Rhmol02G0121300 [Rhododendron molle]|uniref:Uncharacterized protein n=1 Tax=Rhododendron molle TaxID=49168 RepID=A0ACC0PNW9_RHOML|nr:hypothetical protein RHMOL_Rhmol02G0121300 [Rhododendron molle]